MHKKALRMCPKCGERAFQFVETEDGTEICSACFNESYPMHFYGGSAPRRVGSWMDVYELSH